MRVAFPSHFIHTSMDKQDDPLDRPITKRAAYSHLQHLYGSMNRSERLGTCLKLINTALEEVDQSTDSVTVDLTVKGGQTFNGKIEDIEVLAQSLPAKVLIELGFDILATELRAIHTTTPKTNRETS